MQIDQETEINPIFDEDGRDREKSLFSKAYEPELQKINHQLENNKSEGSNFNFYVLTGLRNNIKHTDLQSDAETL